MHDVQNCGECAEMCAMDRPVDRQAVPQEDPPRRPKEVPLPGRLMHHRAEVVAARPARQNTPDQTRGSSRAGRAVTARRRRLIRFLGLVLGRELQARRQGVAQATHHLGRPLQVQETAGHVRIRVRVVDGTEVRLQDRDFRLPPSGPSAGSDVRQAPTTPAAAPTTPAAAPTRATAAASAPAIGPHPPTPWPPPGRDIAGLRRRLSPSGAGSHAPPRRRRAARSARGRSGGPVARSAGARPSGRPVRRGRGRPVDRKSC